MLKILFPLGTSPAGRCVLWGKFNPAIERSKFREFFKHRGLRSIHREKGRYHRY